MTACSISMLCPIIRVIPSLENDSFSPLRLYDPKKLLTLALPLMLPSLSKEIKGDVSAPTVLLPIAFSMFHLPVMSIADFCVEQLIIVMAQSADMIVFLMIGCFFCALRPGRRVPDFVGLTVFLCSSTWSKSTGFWGWLLGLGYLLIAKRKPMSALSDLPESPFRAV